MKQIRILDIIIVFLLAIILLQKCNKTNIPLYTPSVIRDTTWKIKESTIITNPQLIKTIHSETLTKEFIHDTTIVEKYLASNIYTDSIKIDSIGYINIYDTINKNLIAGRSTKYNLKYPIIKETVTIYPKPKSQLYIGFTANGNKDILIDQMGVNMLLKNKKEQLFGINAMISTQGKLNYGVSSYWKIKLHN